MLGAGSRVRNTLYAQDRVYTYGETQWYGNPP